MICDCLHIVGVLLSEISKSSRLAIWTGHCGHRRRTHGGRASLALRHQGGGGALGVEVFVSGTFIALQWLEENEEIKIED